MDLFFPDGAKMNPSNPQKKLKHPLEVNSSAKKLGFAVRVKTKLVKGNAPVKGKRTTRILKK